MHNYIVNLTVGFASDFGPEEIKQFIKEEYEDDIIAFLYDDADGVEVKRAHWADA